MKKKKYLKKATTTNPVDLYTLKLNQDNFCTYFGATPFDID